jgi:hypothetical protein
MRRVPCCARAARRRRVASRGTYIPGLAVRAEDFSLLAAAVACLVKCVLVCGCKSYRGR